jgi:hypothetical protein
MGLEGEVEGELELSYSDNRESQRLPHRGTQAVRRSGKI